MSTRSALTALALLVVVSPTPGAAQRSIIVNRVRLSEVTIRDFEERWQVPLKNGQYWYDRASGAWGLDGGPTAGWIIPGLDLGGPLPADASHGNTGVFINGRELPVQDVVALQRITPVYQGRWWVDGYGNVGPEGGAMLTNLWTLARQRGMLPGKSWSVHSKDGNSLVAGDENGCTYFNSRDVGTGSTSWVSPGC